MKGKVTLVGAGIGTAENMTLRAVRALRQADVVIYDRLLGEGVIDMIPQTAERINAGKASANHLIPQEEINRLLINKAMEGKHVVRLKGGDSYLFGRGSEEAEALADAGIEFSVVPGITSAVAAPEFAGIPVTHRGCASSVHIIAAHRKQGEMLNINYKACVEIGGTLVFLMGVKNMGEIADGLINAGMRKDMPCAVVESGGSGRQKKVTAAISEITQAAKDLKSPSVIIVGEVCRFSDKLDYFSKLPLMGKNIIITRPRENAAELSQMLRDLGASVSICPSIRTESVIEDISEIVDSISKYKWIAFTSAAGVRTVFEALFSAGFDSRVFGGSKIASVGQKTAAELMKYGIKTDLVPENYYVKSLAEELVNIKAESVLMLRAQKGAVTNVLKNGNIPHKEIAVYRTVCIEAELPQNADYVVFASPSEVFGFKNYEMGCKGICIGEKTAEEARRCGICCKTAKKQSNEGIVECILEDIQNEQSYSCNNGI